MKILSWIFLVFAFLLLSSFFSPKAFAALNYGNGEYTNLCGTGYAATANTCNKGCNTGNGSCTSTQHYVVKYTCNGRVTECRSNESDFATSQSLSGAGCGKTVQIDVFTKNCRTGGSWNCGDSDLLDYMVWYSGDCGGTTPRATPTPTPKEKHISSCDELRMVSGAGSFAPTNITLRARASDNRGDIQGYKFYYGDGKQEETTNKEVTHRYESSGFYTAHVDVKDSKSNWITSPACEIKMQVLGLPIESHKSGCSDVFITSGNNSPAPATGKFTATGFDNKGSIKQYKMDFGNGVTKESTNGVFEQIYERPGTYTVRGYIQDSKSAWLGGSGTCEKTLSVLTKPITTQPATGTPTTFTLIALGSGVAAGILYLLKVRSAAA